MSRQATLGSPLGACTGQHSGTRYPHRLGGTDTIGYAAPGGIRRRGFASRSAFGRGTDATQCRVPRNPNAALPAAARASATAKARTRSARESEPLRRNAGHAVAAGRQCATSAILRDGDGSVMPQEMTRITSHTPSHKSRRTWRASSLPWERHSFGRAAPVGSARTRTASAGGGLQQGGWSWTQQPAGYSVRRAPGRASGLRFGRKAPRRDARPADRTDASVSTVGCFGTSAPWEASDYCMARSRPLMGRSPRKHRAMVRRQRRVIATDLTVEESPEVGQLASTLPRRAPACGS